MREKGIVRAIEGGEAVVSLKRHSACPGCKACSVSSNGDITIKAAIAGQVKAGDEVTLEIDSSSMIKAIVLVYLLPAVFFIIGVLAGLKIAPSIGIHKHKELIAIFTGALLLAVSLFLARQYGKTKSGTYQAKII